MDKRVDAEMAIGKWLSAAMEDSNVCGEMKADIVEWFTYLDSRDALETKLRELVKELRASAEVMAMLQGMEYTIKAEVRRQDADMIEVLLDE